MPFGGGEAAGELATAGEGDFGQTGQVAVGSDGPEHGSQRRRLSSRVVAAFTSRLRVELRSIGRTRGSLSAFALSFAVLLLQALSFWLVMRAYGLRLPPGAGAAVFLIVHLGTVMPGAPANVGTYQFFTVLGLTLFDVSTGTNLALTIGSAKSLEKPPNQLKAKNHPGKPMV